MKRQQAQPWNLRTKSEEIAQKTYQSIGRFTEKVKKFKEFIVMEGSHGVMKSQREHRHESYTLKAKKFQRKSSIPMEDSPRK